MSCPRHASSLFPELPWESSTDYRGGDRRVFTHFVPVYHRSVAERQQNSPLTGLDVHNTYRGLFLNLEKYMILLSGMSFMCLYLSWTQSTVLGGTFYRTCRTFQKTVCDSQCPFNLQCKYIGVCKYKSSNMWSRLPPGDPGVSSCWSRHHLQLRFVRGVCSRSKAVVL